MKEPNNSAAASASGATPGPLLKAAREQQGLSVVDVAMRLCLSVQFVQDMEHDDYSQMSARTYARGYVLAYAHLLGVPEDQVLPALTNVPMEFVSNKPKVAIENEQVVPIYESGEPAQQRSGLLLWGSIIVVIILIGLVIMWWRGPAAPNDVKGATTAATSTSIAIQPESAAKPTPTAISAPAPKTVADPTPTPAPAPSPAAPAVGIPRQPPVVSSPSSAPGLTSTPTPVAPSPTPNPRSAVNAPQSSSDPVEPSDLIGPSGNTRAPSSSRSNSNAQPVASLPPPRANADE